MTAIAIFVKTPGFSRVKTRLARDIGEDRAIALYRQCAAAVFEVAGSAAVGPVYWALAETDADAQTRWTPAACIRQGPGGLGERMSRVLAALVERHGSGLLLGADAPQIDTAHLREAAGWLEHPSMRQVVGPARDGGFWTFGANHVVPAERWTGVAYSRPDTLGMFRASIGDEAPRLELPILTDLDT
ncbi:MAG: TIGR04282 family arsenosugar biosynthesis glycosyltransferase, partial [Wenzhouxiangella sp.]